MNTLMWNHPLTAQHLEVVEQVLRGIVVNPVSKLLACNDTGNGALAGVDVIVEAIQLGLSTGGKKKAKGDFTAQEIHDKFKF